MEGLERYPINLRYPRHVRDSIDKLMELPIITPNGAHIPLSRVASIEVVEGPPMIKTENARLNGWIFIDISGIDLGSYMKNAQAILKQELKLPAGYSIAWAGQYEYILRVENKMKLLVPMTLLIIFMLLYLTFKDFIPALIVMLSLPFALAGGFWYLFILDFNLSVAVTVGFIALAGVAAEFGVIMILYLNNALDKYQKNGDLNSVTDLKKQFMKARYYGFVLKP